jgi:hypothetical protein
MHVTPTTSADTSSYSQPTQPSAGEPPLTGHLIACREATPKQAALWPIGISEGANNGLAMRPGRPTHSRTRGRGSRSSRRLLGRLSPQDALNLHPESQSVEPHDGGGNESRQSGDCGLWGEPVARALEGRPALDPAITTAYRIRSPLGSRTDRRSHARKWRRRYRGEDESVEETA